MMRVDEILNELLTAHKMTQMEIAEDIGVKQSAISKYLLRKRKIKLKPGLRLIKLARKKKMKVKYEDLLNE